MAVGQDKRESLSDQVRRRAASRDLVPGLAVLIVSEASLIAMSPDASGWQLAWALSPVLGLGLLGWAQIRIFRRADERERAYELLAMAIAFGVVMFALGGVSALQTAGLGETGHLLQITTGLGIAAWILTSLFLKRRAL